MGGHNLTCYWLDGTWWRLHHIDLILIFGSGQYVANIDVRYSLVVFLACVDIG